MCRYGILAPRCIKCNKAITPSQPHATPGRRPRILYCEEAWERYRTATGLYTLGETASLSSASAPFFAWCAHVVGPEMYHLRALGTSPHEVMQMVQAGLLHFPTMRAQARVRARITVSLPLPLSLALTDYPYIRANEEAYAGRESVLATGLRILEAAGPVDITRSELSAGPWRNVLTGEMETGYPEPTPGSHPEPLGACSPLTAPLVWLACPFRPLTADARGRGHEAFSETVEWVDQCARCETPDPGVQAPTTQNVAWGPASAVGLSLAGNSPADWLAAEMNEWRVCGALQPEAYARACALKGEDIIAGYD